MDIKIIRGEIRRKYFSTYVLVIISILGIIGMLMIYFPFHIYLIFLHLL